MNTSNYETLCYHAADGFQPEIVRHEVRNYPKHRYSPRRTVVVWSETCASGLHSVHWRLTLGAPSKEYGTGGCCGEMEPSEASLKVDSLLRGLSGRTDY